MEGKEFIILTQCTPKSGSTEPEDAFYPKECVSKVSGRAVMAVSDGASGSVYSRDWANMLVELAVHEWSKIHPREMTNKALTHSIKELAKRYDPVGKNANLFVRNKFIMTGSQATLLLVRMQATKQGTFAVHAVARGDSCVLRLDAETWQIKGSFPLQKAGEFTQTPPLVANHISVEELEFRYVEWEMQEKEVLLLASDALAKWVIQVLSKKKTERFTGRFLPSLCKSDRFKRFALAQRRSKGVPMEDDDTTFVFCASRSTYEKYCRRHCEPEKEVEIDVEEVPDPPEKPFPGILLLSALFLLCLAAVGIVWKMRAPSKKPEKPAISSQKIKEAKAKVAVFFTGTKLKDEHKLHAYWESTKEHRSELYRFGYVEWERNFQEITKDQKKIESKNAGLVQESPSFVEDAHNLTVDIQKLQKREEAAKAELTSIQELYRQDLLKEPNEFEKTIGGLNENVEGDLKTKMEECKKDISSLQKKTDLKEVKKSLDKFRQQRDEILSGVEKEANRRRNKFNALKLRFEIVFFEEMKDRVPLDVREEFESVEQKWRESKREFDDRMDQLEKAFSRKETEKMLSLSAGMDEFSKSLEQIEPRIEAIKKEIQRRSTVDTKMSDANKTGNKKKTPVEADKFKKIKDYMNSSRLEFFFPHTLKKDCAKIRAYEERKVQSIIERADGYMQKAVLFMFYQGQDNQLLHQSLKIVFSKNRGYRGKKLDDYEKEEEFLEKKREEYREIGSELLKIENSEEYRKLDEEYRKLDEEYRKLDELDVEYRKLKEEYKKLEEEYKKGSTSQEEYLQEKMNGLQEKMNGLRPKMNGLRPKMNGLQEKMNGLRPKMARVNSLKEKMNTKSQEMKQLEREMDAHREMDGGHKRYLISDAISQTHWKNIMKEKPFPKTYEELSPFLKKLDFRLPERRQLEENGLKDENLVDHEPYNFQPTINELIKEEHENYPKKREKALPDLVAWEKEKIKKEEERKNKKKECGEKEKSLNENYSTSVSQEIKDLNKQINDLNKQINDLSDQIEIERAKSETKATENRLNQERETRIKMIKENFQPRETQIYKTRNGITVYVKFDEEREEIKGDYRFILSRDDFKPLKFRCIFRVD